MYKKEVVQDLGPNSNSGCNTQQKFATPKKVAPRYTQVGGGGGLEGSKLKNSLGDHLVAQNDDFTRVSNPISPTGVCYMNDPKIG